MKRKFREIKNVAYSTFILMFIISFSSCTNDIENETIMDNNNESAYEDHVCNNDSIIVGYQSPYYFNFEIVDPESNEVLRSIFAKTEWTCDGFFMSEDRGESIIIRQGECEDWSICSISSELTGEKIDVSDLSNGESREYETFRIAKLDEKSYEFTILNKIDICYLYMKGKPYAYNRFICIHLGHKLEYLDNPETMEIPLQVVYPNI